MVNGGRYVGQCYDQISDVSSNMEIETKGLEHEVELSKAEELRCTCTVTDVNMPTIAGTPPFRYVRDIPIYFQEDWQTGIGGGLWSTGLAMGQYFSTESAITSLCSLSQRCGTLNVLELGSGNGFLAVCLAAAMTSISSSPNNENKLRIRNLVITDEVNHLNMIQTTVQSNPKALECVDNVAIQEHQWGVFVDNQNSTTESIVSMNKGSCNASHRIVLDGTTKFDLIIGSDVAYHESLYRPLLESMQQFSHKDTISLIGITMTDTKPSFFHQLDLNGFMYQKLADHLLDPQFRGTTFGVFAIQKR